MDDNVMDTKKKVYNTPELVEHGSLIQITQYGCITGAGDPYEGFENLFNSNDICT